MAYKSWKHLFIMLCFHSSQMCKIKWKCMYYVFFSLSDQCKEGVKDKLAITPLVPEQEIQSSYW